MNELHRFARFSWKSARFVKEVDLVAANDFMRRFLGSLQFNSKYSVLSWFVDLYMLALSVIHGYVRYSKPVSGHQIGISRMTSASNSNEEMFLVYRSALKIGRFVLGIEADVRSWVLIVQYFQALHDLHTFAPLGVGVRFPHLHHSTQRHLSKKDIFANVLYINRYINYISFFVAFFCEFLYM